MPFMNKYLVALKTTTAVLSISASLVSGVMATNSHSRSVEVKLPTLTSVVIGLSHPGSVVRKTGMHPLVLAGSNEKSGISQTDKNNVVDLYEYQWLPDDLWNEVFG